MPSAGSVHVDVLPDTKRFGPVLRTQLRQIAATTRSEVSVRVRVDTGAAMTKLRALRTLADQLDGRLVRVGAGGLAATAGASTPMGDVDGGDRTSTVRVNTAQATAALRGVSAQIGALDGRTATVKVQVDKASAARAQKQLRPFTDASPLAVTAMSALVPPAAPLAGAAVGGAAGLLPGLGAAGAGAGAFAAAAVPAIKQVSDAMDLQKAAAEGGAEATEAYEEALRNLSPQGRELASELGELKDEFREWQEGLQVATLPVVTRSVGLLKDNLGQLTPIVQGASRGFDNLLDSAEAGLAGPHWASFISFASRQAEPTITSLGRTIGNLALGATGLMVSFEPLWESMSSGMERSSASFVTWANDSSNFTDFIAWTIENGPMLMGVLGDIGSAIIDVGVAISPLGLVYAQGIGLLAQSIGWLAEHAPGLLQLGVAALTARMALQLFTRINQGLITPLREGVGRVREFAGSLRTVDGAASTAAAGTGRFRGALGGVVGALGGGWGIAIAAGVTLLGSFIASKQEAKEKVEGYTEALRADTGAIGENTRAHAAQALEQEGVLALADELGISMQLVTDAALGQGDAQASLNAELEKQNDRLRERFHNGELTQGMYEQEREKLDNLRIMVGEEATAVDGSAESYRLQAEAVGGATATQDGLNLSLQTGAAAARDLKTALDELRDGTIDVTAAESTFREAVDAANLSVTTNGATLDLTTEAGRRNEQSLRSLSDQTLSFVEAQRENDESAQTMIDTHREGRAEFIKVARQMGLTEEAAEDLADEYLGIPAKVESAILVQASGEWKAIVSNKGGDAGVLPGPAGFYASGGHVQGPGTGTSDSIRAWLSDGEFVQKASAVSKYGVGFMSALNEGQIPQEALPGFAKGGFVSHGKGSTPWGKIRSHKGNVRRDYNRMVSELVGALGDHMGEQFKNSVKGPSGVVRLAEASLGKYPEVPGGSNRNAITSWFGMNGAPWCFAAGTLVQGEAKLVEIQDIAVGDTVRAPSGASRRVAAIYRRRKPLLRVRALGAPDTLATADHPYMTERGWVKAGDLKRGDKVAKPVPATGNTQVEDAFARLVGLYAAEGYRGHRDRCVTLCVSHGEAEQVARLAKEAGYDPHITQHRTCALVSVYDHALYDLLGQVGDGAHRKEVPQFVFDWDEQGRRAFIDGYVSGDGHRPPSREGVVVATTVSKRLAVSLAGLLSTLGVSAAVRAPLPARREVIQGREVNCRAQFVIEWREHLSRKAQHRFDEAVLWVPVRSVVDTGRVDTVYDIQVEDEHAFIANGVHVHNCAMFISWLFARAGASKALGGASRTAWTGDYYTSGMQRTSSPMPGDVAVYGRNHVNLVTSPGGGRRVGGNQSNNVTAGGGYSGGAIFRPNWGAVGFASGGLVSLRDLLAQNQAEDQQAGRDPFVKSIRSAVGLGSEMPSRRARGGPVDSGQWSWVGEEGPELVKFSSPGQVYSAAQSRAIASESAQLAVGGDGAAAPLVGEYHQHLHNGEATFREGMQELTHTLKVTRKGGRYADA